MTKPRPQSESELVELLHSIDVRAPESLHRHVASLVADGSSGGARARWSRRLAARPYRVAAGVLAAAALALALVLGLGGGGAKRLTLPQASALTLRSPTAGAPAELPGGREVAASVDGVAFPYWGAYLGWQATGERRDRVDGRTITTVYYGNGRARIGYSIVAGLPAPTMSGGAILWRGGTPYRLSRIGGTTVVSWLRDGRLCVVSGRGVNGTTLLRLASWSTEGAESS